MILPLISLQHSLLPPLWLLLLQTHWPPCCVFRTHQAHACPRVFALAVPSAQDRPPRAASSFTPIPLKSLFLGQRHGVASWATDIHFHSYPALYVFIALKTTCHCLVHLYQIISLLLERNSVWAYLDSAHSRLHPRCQTRHSVKMSWGK